MKYFIRSVKYFFYFAFLTTAIILALVLAGVVEGDINAIFDGGYEAIWKIAIFFVLVAAVYPKFGFVNRQLDTQADWDSIKKTALDYFQEKPYRLEAEGEDYITFRRKSPMGRLVKMGEDRITISKTDNGYCMEGLRKEVMLYASGIEHLCSLI